MSFVCYVVDEPTKACLEWGVAGDVVASLTELGITPAGVAEAIGWGMGLILMFWAIGFGVAAVQRTIREMGR